MFTTSSVSGVYGEHAIATVSGVHPLPESVTAAQGAVIGVPYYTAHRAITKTRVQPGETVLVHGATGAVGSAAIQMLAHLGCTVIASGGNSGGLSTLTGTAGVQHVVDHSEGSEEQVCVGNPPPCIGPAASPPSNHTHSAARLSRIILSAVDIKGHDGDRGGRGGRDTRDAG